MNYLSSTFIIRYHYINHRKSLLFIMINHHYHYPLLAIILTIRNHDNHRSLLINCYTNQPWSIINPLTVLLVRHSPFSRKAEEEEEVRLRRWCHVGAGCEALGMQHGHAINAFIYKIIDLKDYSNIECTHHKTILQYDHRAFLWVMQWWLIGLLCG